MIHVTAKSFFATIGPLNVHPRAIAVDGKWGLASEWDMADSREVIGKSTVKGYAEQESAYSSDYFVTDAFLATHPTLSRVSAA